MNKYTIVYDEVKERFSLGRITDHFLFNILDVIYNIHDILEEPFSESHMIAILQTYGVVVDLVDHNGEKLVW